MSSSTSSSTVKGGKKLKVQIAGTTDIGNKRENQDVFDSKVFENGLNYVAVYDGHGGNGKLCAEFAKEQVPTLLCKEPNLATAPKAALTSCFAKCHKAMKADIDIYLSGTTATVALVNTEERKIFIGNLGDSGAIVIRKIKGKLETEQITIDHTCENPEEKARLLKRGSRIEPMVHGGEYLGPDRLWKGALPYPGQCVTRTLGDDVAHSIGVSTEPSCSEIPVSSDMIALVLCSDGVWDGLKKEEVASLATVGDVQSAANNLVQAALEGLDKEEIDDNVTAVIVRFLG
eukprot:Nk52_evm32s229 gene=Nk52_evmTU32s229